MKTKSILVSALVFLLLDSASTGFATMARFQGLGGLPKGDGTPYSVSSASAVSADGSFVVGKAWWVVAGEAFGEAFRWTKIGGMQGLGDLQGGGFGSKARAVSADGAVVVGYGWSASGQEAFRWENGVMTGLGDFPGGDFGSDAYGVSGTGSVVVGWGISESGGQAFRWENGLMVGLGDLVGGDFHSEAFDISLDGFTIVGRGYSINNRSEAFRWTESGGMQALGDLPGGEFFSRAHGVSADGSVVVGVSNSVSGSSLEAFRWENGVMVGLGDLAGGDFYSWANDVSGDGSIVVGYSITQGTWSYPSQVNEAFIWDEYNGIQNLQSVLENDYELDLSGWTLTEATGISYDGLTIVGSGINPDGYIEGWIATIPKEPSYCAEPIPGDANGDCKIDFIDLAILVSHWLDCNLVPETACLK